MLLGWVAAQAAAGAVVVAGALFELARGAEDPGPLAAAAALGLAVLVLFSVLLRAGVRRWVRRQPPDPPGVAPT